LTPAAEKERARFIAAFEANLRNVQSISLSILVWGADPTRDSIVARKRREIRDTLIGLGHNAMFSEDISQVQPHLSLKSLEFAQVQAAHLIVILVEDSPGAMAEAHDFCNHPDIAPKVCVLIPRKYKRGYSAQGAIKDLENAHGGVFWYSDQDLSVCRVCSKVVNRAQALRHLRFRGGLDS
jgi:hypothetical protein